MASPILVKPIAAQVINEQAAYGPLDLKEYIQADGSGSLQFSAALEDGKALAKGLICTEDGLLTGIPAKDSQGTYEIIVEAKNAEGSVKTSIILTIKPSLLKSDIEYLNELKNQVWEAVEKKLPIPELGDIYQRPMTVLDIYYLLERWAVLKIWDAFNLDLPGKLIPLALEGMSSHYHVFDRGSCLVAVPKDLFSHERTIEDGLKTARAMAREVYKRHWTIELVGFDKMMRAAWVEIQHLGDRYDKPLEIINYEATPDDLKLYYTQHNTMAMRSGLE